MTSPSLPDRQIARLRSLWSELDESTINFALAGGEAAAVALARWRTASRAMLFHLGIAGGGGPVHVVLLGGTGVGKSTLVNRLLESEVSATSHRRTYTRGPVIAISPSATLDGEWSGLVHSGADEAEERRGEEEVLQTVRVDSPLLETIHLADSTDVDGDCEKHHELARRVFQWAEALLVVMTPEKYQMTETMPYLESALARRMPVWFVMNKCEESAVFDDFVSQLVGRGWEEPAVFAIPRDRSEYQPAEGASLEDLRSAIASVARPSGSDLAAGLRARGGELTAELRETVLEPLVRSRAVIDEIRLALESILAPEPGVDVSPVTRRLERRLHERSVLYLAGPGRVMDRVRNLPAALSRMPRGAWDLLARGALSTSGAPPEAGPGSGGSREEPDYGSVITDQFMIIQSRIEDILRSRPESAAWTERDREGFERTRIDPSEAAEAANRELQDLRKWLSERWDSTPRDTRILRKMLGALPGGEKLTQWSEAAPWVLALILSVHGAFLGPVDLLILGGFGLASWAGEKLSNEVSARARETNRAITRDFHVLVRRQIDQTLRWVESKAPESEQITRAADLADRIDRELKRLGAKAKS